MTLSITSRRNMAQRDLIAWLTAGGLAGALSLGLPGTILAQDTSTTARQQDTTQAAARADSTSSDSTKWGYSVERHPSQQNPQGYRGMERPSSLSDSGSVSDTVAPADATSRVNQMERQDSINRPGENPPGYRGMERPAALDSARKQASDTGKTSRAAHEAHTQKQSAKSRTKSKKTAARDSSAQDSTKWGYKVDRKSEDQNPPGYRGMERPSNVLPPDSARNDSGAPADATSRVNQMERQDSLPQGAHQNPPGYRGMERPAALDSAQQQSGNRDSVSRLQPGNDSVNVNGGASGDTARVSQ
jgi:hypothetical protein